MGELAAEVAERLEKDLDEVSSINVSNFMLTTPTPFIIYHFNCKTEIKTKLAPTII